MTPQQVEKLLNSPACLRGRAWARREAARESEPGTDDYRVNMQRAAELEQAMEGKP